MQLGDTQLGKPAVLYKNTKANIEALSGIAQGAIAYATDTDELGTYDGVSAWTWSAGGGGGGAWGSITGTLSSQTDLQSALDGKQAADADLTAIAALTPTNDDVLQRKAGVWTNRTLAQLITDLGLGSLAFLSSLAHSALSGIGTNTHSQIDTFISTTAPATYAPIAKGVTNGDSHDHTGGDGGTIAHANLLGITSGNHNPSNSTISPTTADTTAAVNTRYLADISGLTAERNFKLPAGTAGDIIELKITIGDDTYELIVKGDTSITINSGSAATEWSRLFITGEFVRFIATSSTNWAVLDDHRIPCIGMLERIATSLTTNTAATQTTPDWNQATINQGDICDLTNNRIKIRRAGYYEYSAQYMPNGGFADGKYGRVYVVKNSTNIAHAGNRAAAAGTSLVGANLPSRVELCATDDTLTYQYMSEEADKGLICNSTGFEGSNFFRVTEIL